MPAPCTGRSAEVPHAACSGRSLVGGQQPRTIFVLTLGPQLGLGDTEMDQGRPLPWGVPGLERKLREKTAGHPDA